MDITAEIEALIGREGEYSDHPADKGGPTRWGLTERIARAHGYKGDMRVLPRELAIDIFLKQYYLLPKLDQVAQRYPLLARELFDISVNMGQAVAATFLQRCLNVLNDRGKLYSDIGVDGMLGPVSMLALDNYRQRRGDEGQGVLLIAVRSLRGNRYIEISEGRQDNEAFTYGWFRRMVEMLGKAFG